MDDGVRIALSLHLPDDAPPPWPVVFEARPYRKDDVSDASALYRRLCDEGALAVCRADVRGTGSSEGVAEDEYTPRELEDHLATISWLADREWSNGSVGMFGTSYSGFNSLQVAALRPPALKAIIPIYATDRRYTDDVHYGGGAMRGSDFLDYPMLMVAMNALPPVPSVFGEGWREEWLRRIETTEPWFLPWLEHQREDEYWRHGSVWFQGYETIEAATMIIAGHADGYHNMAFRGFERLSGPKRLLFGPWSHMSPRFSMPGPRIDHVPEMIKWWHRWLRGDDNGVDPRTSIAIFVRRSTPPRADLDAYEGEWRFEPTWPPARLREERRQLGADDDTLHVRGDVGVTGSIWCAADLPFGEPWDQRPDEAFSLVYDWPSFDQPLEIMGHPRVRDQGQLEHPRRLPLGEALRRLPRRVLGPRHPRDPEPHPPRVPRGADAARSRRGGGGHDRARRDIVDLGTRPYDAARSRRKRLSVELAAARGRRPHRRPIRVRARTSGARGSAARRRAADVLARCSRGASARARGLGDERGRARSRTPCAQYRSRRGPRHRRGRSRLRGPLRR